MKKIVIIVAGGKGIRMESDLPKQFIPLCGKPVLMHTLAVFHRWDADAEIVLVLPEAYTSYWAMLCRELNLHIPHRVINGGQTRFHSVRNGLRAFEGDGLVAIHDAVRPFVADRVINACFSAAALYGAAIPVIPVKESVREMIDGQSRPFDRSRLYIVQTPQVFQTPLLQEAYRHPYAEQFTDDATVWEAAGNPVHLVEGNPENIKLTTPPDLLYAEAILKFLCPSVPPVPLC